MAQSIQSDHKTRKGSGDLMRMVYYTDKYGYKHRAQVRDTDPDSFAPMGIPCDPPDLSQIDWDGVKRDLYNTLLERGLTNWQEVNLSQGNLRSVIQDVLYRRLIALYRQKQ